MPLLFRTGKNINGRYVTSPGADGDPPIVRYYPHERIEDFRAAILAELGEPAGTRMIDVFYRFTVVEGGWRKDDSGLGPAAKERPGGKRQVPHAAIERINALGRRLLRMGDEDGAEECRKAIEELRGWSDRPTTPLTGLAARLQDPRPLLPAKRSLEVPCMPKTQPRYVAQLLAAKADEDRCCFISDGSQLGATVLYRGDRWHVIQHAENIGIGADAIALVTLDEEADPDKLTAVALATDFEDEPLWLIDVRRFDELGGYGRALKVLWRSERA